MRNQRWTPVAGSDERASTLVYDRDRRERIQVRRLTSFERFICERERERESIIDLVTSA